MYLKNPKEKWYLKLKNILQKMKKVSDGGREGENYYNKFIQLSMTNVCVKKNLWTVLLYSCD